MIRSRPRRELCLSSDPHADRAAAAGSAATGMPNPLTRGRRCRTAETMSSPPCPRCPSPKELFPSHGVSMEALCSGSAKPVRLCTLVEGDELQPAAVEPRRPQAPGAQPAPENSGPTADVLLLSALHLPDGRHLRASASFKVTATYTRDDPFRPPRPLAPRSAGTSARLSSRQDRRSSSSHRLARWYQHLAGRAIRPQGRYTSVFRGGTCGCHIICGQEGRLEAVSRLVIGVRS